MNTTLIILWYLGWTLGVIATGMLATIDSAFRHLRMREVVESKGSDHTRLNRWLQWSSAIKASVAVWHTLLLCVTAAAVPVIVYFTRGQTRFFISIIICCVMLIFIAVAAVLAPRFLAARLGSNLALRLISFLHIWALVTRPLTYIILQPAQIIARIAGVNTQEENPFNADIETNKDAHFTDNNDTLEAEEHEMLKSIFEFGDTIVREVMTPRTRMVAIAAATTLDDAISLAMEEGHSRLPVYEKDIDHIVGIFYLRDALTFWKHTDDNDLPNVSAIMHEAFFVPETKKVNELLREFRVNKTQMAVIVDEYAGTAGLATLEDLIEEIVGEIQDEYDSEPDVEYVQVDDTTWRLDASMAVDDVNNLINIELPEDEDFDTVGGYVMFTLGHVPEEGEVVEEEDFTMKILTVENRRIQTLEIRTHNLPENSEQNS